jgi:DNA gyrase/topoisomerase IV subunit A
MKDSKLKRDLRINIFQRHIIDGLLKARKNMDEIFEIKNTEENPKKVLIERFSLSRHQAQCILELKKPLDEIDEEKLLEEQRNLIRIGEEIKRKRS